MGFNTFSGLLLCLILLFLTAPSHQLNWQGTGSMNSTVMASIASFTNTLPTTGDTFQADSYIQGMRDSFNSQWDQAWNVVLVNQLPQYDAVVYGYAFNNQWMWVNGMPSDDQASRWSVIIWKDYNCHIWHNINDLFNTAKTFTQAQITSITDQIPTGVSLVKTDVWTYAHNFVNNVQSALANGAVTVVMSQDPTPYFYGNVCMVNKNWHSSNNLGTIDSASWGGYFLFQTRLA